RLLMEHDVSGLPVVDRSGRLVGVVTEADLVSKEAYGRRRRRLLGVVSDALSGDSRWAQKAEGLTAADVMTRQPQTAAPNEEVGRLARRMLERGIKRVPVVEDGRLVGIVTRHDLLRVFDRTDEHIEADIRARLASPVYTPEDQAVTFSVADGVVTLEGSVRFAGDRPVVEGMVRNVPGVVAVDSRLAYLEPNPS
ncbi:MAG TPA: CBS domain-containing protein, partial [Acidimicrobiia bacterium]|nr:CBS domain-containing protein [Acidimicrobiia bacterium]